MIIQVWSPNHKEIYRLLQKKKKICLSLFGNSWLLLNLKYICKTCYGRRSKILLLTGGLTGCVHPREEGLKHIYSSVKYFKIKVWLEILAEAELSVLNIPKGQILSTEKCPPDKCWAPFKNVPNYILRAESLIPFSWEISVRPARLRIFTPQVHRHVKCDNDTETLANT